MERRYDIDWIRVIAFDTLILYHVGMFFVPWGWHIKNNEIIDWLQWPMLFVNQWRLPILFVVSGMGTAFAFSSKSGPEYIKERLTRLLIPLIVGILVVVPPQVYIERLVQGKAEGSFLTFYPDFFQGTYPNGNFSWHHLWFLPYLLLMSLLATPLFTYIRKGKSRALVYLNKLISKYSPSLYLFVIPLFIVELFLEPLFPVTNALTNDWYALSRYTILFISGYILMADRESFWISVDKIKTPSLIMGIISFPALLWLWYNTQDNILIPLIKTVNMWSWIIAIFGFAALFLNRRSTVISYRNQAVYPFYILHQTFIVIIGYWLMNNPMHYLWKFTIMAIGTYGLSWLIFEFIIRRNFIIGILFGVKGKKTTVSFDNLNPGSPITKTDL